MREKAKKEKTRTIGPEQQWPEIELLASLALRGAGGAISGEQILEFRREVEADPGISAAVKERVRKLSDRELGVLLL